MEKKQISAYLNVIVILYVPTVMNKTIAFIIGVAVKLHFIKLMSTLINAVSSSTSCRCVKYKWTNSCERRDYLSWSTVCSYNHVSLICAAVKPKVNLLLYFCAFADI